MRQEARKSGSKENPKKDLDYVDPFLLMDLEGLRNGSSRERAVTPFNPDKPQEGYGLFITGTDTGVGKTFVTYALGTLLKHQGKDIGVLKPIQCGGNDARFLKQSLHLRESLEEMNPYFFKEAVSPHLAFPRHKLRMDVERIRQLFQQMQKRHEIVLVEGAGGLCVPIQEDYGMVDLMRDLNLPILIVSRLGLGTINHTLLTIHYARARGLTILGVVFHETRPVPHGLPEKTNPDTIAKLGSVPLLGTVPFLKNFQRKDVIQRCQPHVRIDLLLGLKSEQSNMQLPEEDKKYIWHPFTQMQDWLEQEPLIIDSAQDCYLKDINGRRYLDGVSSLWVNVHGHQHPHLNQALVRQIHKVSHTTLLGLANTPSIELAKKLVESSPRGLTKVFYSDDGSTAVEVAVKMAYQFWQNRGLKSKQNFVYLNHAYHGDTLGSVSIGGIDLFNRIFRHLTFKAIKMDFPDGYRAPSGRKYPNYFFEHTDHLENLLKKSHDRIAALVIEPIVQAAAGMIVWPKGILKRLRELCDKYNILLIADEVATGFGRMGKMFACQDENVTPDLMCLAKSLTGGYLPLAATLSTQKIFDGFLFDYKEQKAFFHGHTYTGNPLGCAAALANLEIFEREKTLEQLAPKIKFLSSRLQSFYNLRHVGHVRQKGFMAGIELVKDKHTKNPYAWEERMGVRVCQEVRKKGVILRPLGNVIVLMPPLVIHSKDLDRLLEVTYGAIEHVTSHHV